MGEIASQITSLTIVYSTVYSGADQRKHQSSVSLAFVWRIHRWPVNSPHKWSVTRKMFPFDDVIMVLRRDLFDRIAPWLRHARETFYLWPWFRLTNGQKWWAVMFTLLLEWTTYFTNSRLTSGLRHHEAHVASLQCANHDARTSSTTVRQSRRWHPPVSHEMSFWIDSRPQTDKVSKLHSNIIMFLGWPHLPR